MSADLCPTTGSPHRSDWGECEHCGYPTPEDRAAVEATERGIRELTPTLGEFIRKHRQQEGMTQQLVADLMPGWHQPTIWKTEAGKRPLLFEEAVALSHVLRFDIADLAAVVPVPEICRTCRGKPPRGFSCNACGRSS